MTLPDIIDENRNIQAVDKFLKFDVVAIIIFCEIHGQDLRLHFCARMLLLNLLGECLKLRFSARDEDKVESFLCELESELFAKAVGCSGDDSPSTWLAVFAKLSKH